VVGTEEAVEAVPSAPGFGLIGLRERARSVGGRLDAEPVGHGGFRVSAHLPTGGDVE